ncbi:MAG: glycosyltransferase family 4 protein [Anaerolineae bacterium]|nr:glycosyltransferase family 4 protein [Anaerolineae bacterium]
MSSIGLDYTAAYEQGGGIGRYVRELVTALSRLDTSNQYSLFVSGASSTESHPAFPSNYFWKPTRLTPKWLARIWYRAQLPLPVELFTGRLDLFHATDFVLPPTLPRVTSLLTVHDLSFVRVPESASPSLKSYLDVVVPRSVYRSTHVLADSEATKIDLMDLYSVPDSKITVLLSGVDAKFFDTVLSSSLMTTRKKYAVEAFSYIFCVGTVQPRKNYTRLIQSLTQLRTQGIDIHLVIAGGKGWLENPIYKTISDTHMEDFVHFIGFVDDEDLPALYRGATCVAFPSLYEGFGLPILEGMASGVPVLTSNVSSLPEVAGDAAIMVDPYDLDAITDGLQRLILDSQLRETLIQKGLIRAREFTWEKSARQLLAIYQNLLA